MKDTGLQVKLLKTVVIAGAACLVSLGTAQADNRRFTYTYEPEILPQGGTEFEQWVTLRSQRTKGGEVQQENYNLWEIREELEYGVTDNYSVSLYLNFSNESFRDHSQDPIVDVSHFNFDGVSIENRYMVWDPAKKPVGLTVYLEPRFSGDEAELEQKIIIGQRHGDWKWAVNLVHATEWEDNWHETEGEVELDFGIARDLNSKWSLGLELRDHNELPEYHTWENTAVYLGPTVSYRSEKWWAAFSVMPQIFGANFAGNVDDNSSFELEGHEHLNIRLLVGISF